jgi:gas vesicle protein
MKKLFLLLMIVGITTSIYSCRETTKEKSEEAVKAIGEDIETNVKKAGEKIEEGAKKVEEGAKKVKEDVQEKVEDGKKATEDMK